MYVALLLLAGLLSLPMNRGPTAACPALKFSPMQLPPTSFPPTLSHPSCASVERGQNDPSLCQCRITRSLEFLSQELHSKPRHYLPDFLNPVSHRSVTSIGMYQVALGSCLRQPIFLIFARYNIPTSCYFNRCTGLAWCKLSSQEKSVDGGVA
jgi:hypothetical protein